VTLLLQTGIRVGECAALNVEDVYAQSRKNKVIIRSGKGDRYREVPLNHDACEALLAWLEFLAKKYGSPKVSSPLFPNPQGGRMTTAALDLVVRKLGQEVGLQISPHVLRHTLVTNLVKGGNDLVLVAEIAGHEKVETTTRYSLSTAEDKEQALFRLVED
jgi:site-specific recombinase XerD